MAPSHEKTASVIRALADAYADAGGGADGAPSSRPADPPSSPPAMPPPPSVESIRASMVALAGERDAIATVVDALVATGARERTLERWLAYGAAVGRARAAGKLALRETAEDVDRAYFARAAARVRGPAGGYAAMAVAHVAACRGALAGADADGDGKLSALELHAAFDVDGDGVVTAEELAAPNAALADAALAERDWLGLGRALRVGREFRSMLARRLTLSGAAEPGELPRDTVRQFLRRYLAECSLSDGDGAALTDNAFVALPPRSAREFGVRPNAPDRPGDSEERVWVGRMWQLREHLAARKRAEAVGSAAAAATATAGAGAQAQQQSQQQQQQQQGQQHRAPRHQPRGQHQQRKHSSSSGEKEAAAACLIQSRWRGARERRRAALTELDALDAANPRGCVLLALGGAGLARGALRLARALAGAGFVVLAPEGMASTRGERNRAPGVPAALGSYWDDLGAYPGGGAGGDAPPEPLEDLAAFREGASGSRARVGLAELSFVLRRLPRWARRCGATLLGVGGEGGMLAAQLDDSHMGETLLGKVIVGWPCEAGAWAAPGRAGINGSREHPVMAIIGAEDEFFGQEGAGGTPMHAGAALAAHSPLAGLSVVVEGVGHDVTADAASDELVRELLLTFMHRPHRCAALPELWAHEPRLLACLAGEELAQGADVLTVRARPKEAAKVDAAEKARLLL